MISMSMEKPEQDMPEESEKSGKSFKYDVAVIGGCGHVGLPLGLVFADAGLNVLGVDINLKAIKTVSSGIMPFMEDGADEILKRVINKNFILTDKLNLVSDAEYIFITTGTPVDENLTSDLSQVESVVNSLIPLLRKGQTLIFRSTLAPKTTDYIRAFLSSKTDLKVGEEIHIIFAPERLVQGKGIKELKTLPQIVAAYNDKGFNHGKKLFSRMTKKDLIRLTPLEAELCKLFANNWRYVSFGLANEYFMIADRLGANAYNIIEAANHDYPRSKIPMPGFAKGPCLGKDSWLLVNSIPYMGHSTGIISSAYRVNEGLPSYIIHRIKEEVPDLDKKKIAVLGLTFKRDIDDLRDSLGPKLVKIMKNEFLDFEVHDPFIDEHSKDLDKKLKQADVVIVSMNHSAYEDPALLKHVKDGALVVDIWNIMNDKEFMRFHNKGDE